MAATKHCTLCSLSSRYKSGNDLKMLLKSLPGRSLRNTCTSGISCLILLQVLIMTSMTCKTTSKDLVLKHIPSQLSPCILGKWPCRHRPEYILLGAWNMTSPLSCKKTIRKMLLWVLRIFTSIALNHLAPINRTSHRSSKLTKPSDSIN